MDAPIGVFDSGVGGLTVLRALMARLPSEHTIYLGDTARVPYGTRSREVVTRYALLCARHLAAQGIKMLVVACNTVSADSLPALAEALPIPVVGVIEPGAQAAAARTRGGSIASRRSRPWSRGRARSSSRSRRRAGPKARSRGWSRNAISPTCAAPGPTRSCSAARITRCSRDRKSTRLNSSHDQISYAVFCLKKKKKHKHKTQNNKNNSQQ